MTARPEPTIDFVLGTGRCGSTLLHELICRHPATAFLSNLEDRTTAARRTARWNGSLYRRLPPSFTEKGRLRFAPSEGYGALEREVSPMLAMSDRDLDATDATPWLSDRLRGFFAGRAATAAAPAYVHKFTGWPRAGLLHEVFPDARYVHVVRDGRAVAASWLQMPWWLGYRGPGHWHWGPLPDGYRDEWERSGRSFVVLAGIAWKLLLDASDAARAAVPRAQWLDVRYEDLLADPSATLRAVVAFLGLPEDARFDAAVARYRFDATRMDGYRRALGPMAVDALDASLAGHLARFGYDAHAPQPALRRVAGAHA